MSIYFDIMSNNFPFSIESIGENWSQPDVIRPQGYPYYHWIQTTNGQGRIFISGKSYTLSQNTGILIAPFIPHEYYSISNNVWETAFITFKGFLSHDIRQIIPNDYLYLSNTQNFKEKIHNLIEMHLSQQKNEQQLSLEVYDFLLQLRPLQTNSNALKDSLFQAYVAPVVAYIETSFAEELTVEILAKQVFITPQYLTRLFKKYFNTTTSNYLFAFRITKAKELLVVNSDYEIQMISQLVGFKSASHFIAMFKKETGYTPADFRNLYVRN